MTNTFTPNTLAWFEVATDDPDTATSFQPPAGPPFAYVRDPVGSLFGVFTPPA
jgi:hypothetical protein